LIQLVLFSDLRLDDLHTGVGEVNDGWSVIFIRHMGSTKQQKTKAQKQQSE